MYKIYNAPELVDLIEAVNVFLDDYEKSRIEANKRDNTNKKVIPTVEDVKRKIAMFKPSSESNVDVNND